MTRVGKEFITQSQCTFHFNIGLLERILGPLADCDIAYHALNELRLPRCIADQ